MDSQIAGIYGNRVRLRVCGLLRNGDRLLMINHRGLSPGDFWGPPGGGLEFGETVEMTLKREFLEETGLSVTVGKFRFGCELVRPPLHAIELFYDVERISGDLIRGHDPELQIIENVTYLDFPTLYTIPVDEKHGIFNIVGSWEAFERLQGFYTL
jgi:8-oxo-dGTP diphosphatase